MKYQILYRHGKPIIAGQRVHYVGGNLAAAWAEAFAYFGIEEKSWHRVLLIGMGASLIELLARSSQPPRHIIVLEKDPDMVRLQTEYFRFPLPYEVYIGDARQTLLDQSPPFDGIFVDAFEEEEVPSSLLEEDFVKALYDRLAPLGLLFWNVLLTHQSRIIGERIAAFFSKARRFRYSPHTFWAAAHTAEAFPLPF